MNTLVVHHAGLPFERSRTHIAIEQTVLAVNIMFVTRQMIGTFERLGTKITLVRSFIAVRKNVLF